MRREHRGLIYGLQYTKSPDSTVWVTEEHPVLVRRRGKTGTAWVRADELTGGRPGANPGIENWREYAVVPRSRPRTTVESLDVVAALGERYLRIKDGCIAR